MSDESLTPVELARLWNQIARREGVAAAWRDVRDRVDDAPDHDLDRPIAAIAVLLEWCWRDAASLRTQFLARIKADLAADEPSGPVDHRRVESLRGRRDDLRKAGTDHDSGPADRRRLEDLRQRCRARQADLDALNRALAEMHHVPR